MPRKTINVNRSRFPGWKWIVGLTGGLGTGKTTVLKAIKVRRIFTLDADKIVRQFLDKDRLVKNKIRKAFGSDVVTKKGQLNRKRLAQKVFSSTLKRKKLERILHPLVRQEMWRQLKRKKGKIVVCDVPLLYESGWDRFFDRTIVVSASLEKRLKRLKKRGFEKKESLARIKAQMPLSKKIKKADFVINNNGTMENTKKQIHKIIKTILISNKGRSNGFTSRT